MSHKEGFMIKKISFGEKQLALIIKNNYSKEDTEFFTNNDTSLQIGYMPHKRGDIISAHIHNSMERKITDTPEVLIIKKGKMRLDLYNDKKEYVESTILEQGDIVLLSSGGHGLKCLEDTEIIEIKQGPYFGHDDKIRYTGISDDEVIIND